MNVRLSHGVREYLLRNDSVLISFECFVTNGPGCMAPSVTGRGSLFCKVICWLSKPSSSEQRQVLQGGQRLEHQCNEGAALGVGCSPGQGGQLAPAQSVKRP